jgi:protein tyrosine phosphatase (PTP) superfamily phosphohydrolase (DUF442 family)
MGPLIAVLSRRFLRHWRGFVHSADDIRNPMALPLMTPRFLAPRLAATFLLIVAVSVGARAADPDGRTLPDGVKAIEAPGIHNLFSIGDKVYSGSAPEGDEGFATLKRLGVRTIITVDGASPDLEAARRHGFRYVHLPHGYDGIDTNLQARLARAGEVLEGPIFVHCHHGKHRGPTAAAVLCLANGTWNPAQAEAWLKAAGTSSAYEGLYKTVREWRKPDAAVLREVPADFPEVAKVSGLVESMVRVDDIWGRLQAVRRAGYQAPKEHPDLNPANEAVILWEQYREAQRLPDAQRLGQEFLDRLQAAERDVQAAERALREFAERPDETIRARLDAAFDVMGKACGSCHRAHRDRPITQ